MRQACSGPSTPWIPGFRLLDETRNQRLRQNKVSISAGLIHERAAGTDLPFPLLVQADVVCWLRSVLVPDELGWKWYPRLLNLAEYVETLPLFVRATRVSVFEQVAPVLGVPDRATLLERWAALPERMFDGPERFWGGRGRYERMIQLESLGTR